jgi:chromosome segregation and condensation protein ScpB
MDTFGAHNYKHYTSLTLVCRCSDRDRGRRSQNYQITQKFQSSCGTALIAEVQSLANVHGHLKQDCKFLKF